MQYQPPRVLAYQGSGRRLSGIEQSWLCRSALAQTGRRRCSTTGAHQFRHGLATEMLRQGASLDEIGEVLGHHHPQTTTIYAKVALKALRTLALPWPGDAR